MKFSRCFVTKAGDLVLVQLAFVRLGAVICRRGEERERGGSTMQTQLIFNSIVLKMRFSQNEILERGEVKWTHCIISQTSVTLVAGSRYCHATAAGYTLHQYIVKGSSNVAFLFNFS